MVPNITEDWLMKLPAGLPAALAGLLALTACAGSDTGGPPVPTVVVSAYPLEFAAEAVAGPHAEVVNLVPAGAEPHDFELSPADVAAMDRADVVVTVGGFQPAVDAAAAEVGGLDLAPALDLQTRGGHLDPHFWLDPQRLAAAAAEIAEALSQADPARAGEYEANLGDLAARLTDLHTSFDEGLSACAFDTFVTGHTAFGYLAEAYGLREVAIAGIDPEPEPSPAALAATREEVRALGLPTILAEPGDNKVAEVLAAELGIEAATLDPLEAVPAGEDYLSLMYANLEALQRGLQCR